MNHLNSTNGTHNDSIHKSKFNREYPRILRILRDNFSCRALIDQLLRLVKMRTCVKMYVCMYACSRIYL